MKNLVLAAMMAAVLVINSFATTYTGSVAGSVGSGENTAYIAIDFNSDNAFVFEYKWDGEATGWDALLALDDAKVLNVGYWDMGWGIWIYDFDCTGGVEFDYGTSANTGWAYYTSVDNMIWQYSVIGVTDRVLSDGVWDSWVWSNYPTDWSMPIREPGQVAVPEPAALSILAFGVVMAARKRK